ncbi:response regulator transcription factor [Cupriavidus gilardii]|uniref:response regulator transcription factor n=1 Tax=Cupriavidus gilardii TaxID=82541 RepID=UPI001EE50FAE|nr:response regulator transcription factor [Cupriavidus gilardii]MCG5261984.1 response regulator transcription factor [Cupriavidus gilardii]MDF9430150.1 response regulator transcription factor [Cupriavidus gilardii]
MATILLIEPHPLLRLGLRQLLAQSELPVHVIDVEPAMLPSPDDARLRDADLLIYGWHDDGSGTWRAMEDLCRYLAPQRVLVLADGLPSGMSHESVPPLVAGLLSKNCCAEVLDAAIRLVLAGGECFPALTHAEPMQQSGLCAMQTTGNKEGAATRPDEPIASMRGPGGWSPDIALRTAPLIQPDIETPSFGSHLLNITERQYEVLALLARGYPIKTVSRVLNISVATAKTHACTLYHRLHVRNKGEAVYEALRRGAKLNWPGPSSLGAVPLHAEGIRLPAVCQAA